MLTPLVGVITPHNSISPHWSRLLTTLSRSVISLFQCGLLCGLIIICGLNGLCRLIYCGLKIPQTRWLQTITATPPCCHLAPETYSWFILVLLTNDSRKYILPLPQGHAVHILAKDGKTGSRESTTSATPTSRTLPGTNVIKLFLSVIYKFS